MRFSFWGYRSSVPALGGAVATVLYLLLGFVFSSPPLVGGVATLATSAASSVPNGAVIARIGDREITSGELQRRYRSLSPAQRGEFEAQQGQRTFLEQVLVPEQLYWVHAQRKGYFASARDVALVSALEAAERHRSEQRGVEPERVARYLEEHRRFFERSPSIQIWRIQLRTRQRAEQILGELAKEGMAGWKRMCREHSTDAATNMRAGNLGFVFPNGHTNHPEVRVSPQLFQAAAHVKDGQLVPEPVAEGGSFAVVWRKASRPAIQVEASEARDRARALLTERDVVARLQQLRQELRSKGLSQLEPSRLGLLQSWLASRTRTEADEPQRAPQLQGLRISRPRATQRGLR